ncbi:hypothetical protein Trydic_g5949 [Trypoxylus dichotomus]
MLMLPSSFDFSERVVQLLLSVSVYALVFVERLVVASPLDPLEHVKVIDLNSWIGHFEPASYEPAIFRAQHHRIRRSSGEPPFINLNISGHGRIFKLKLAPDHQNLFPEDAVFESTNGPISFEPTSVYRGTLEDDDTATVHGIITRDGLFDGTVFTAADDFYVEPVGRYVAFDGAVKKSPPFHSIIYKSTDVRDISRTGASCASHRLHLNEKKKYHTYPKARTKRWLLEGEAKNPYDELERFPKSKLPPNPPYDQPIDEIEVDLANRTFTDASSLVFGRNVNKRAVIDPKKTTCMLYLQADHQFFQKYGTEEACIEVMTRHVQRVNSIYRSTDFNQDGKTDNITFMVKRIKVHTLDALKDPLYRFPNNYGVEKFLELFSVFAVVSWYILEFHTLPSTRY